MLCDRTKRVMAIVLMIALQSYSSASTGSAMLHTTGTVQVNGTIVPGTVAMAGGENVLVAGSSSASLRMPGTSILAAPYTSLKWISPQEITLNDGNIFVNTLKDIKTNLGICGSVIPTESETSVATNAYTKYEIQIQGNKAIVYARELPVTVKTDNRSIDLQPLRVAVVENIHASKCTVAYYGSEEDLLAKGILIGSNTAAAVVLLTLPTPTPKQPISAESP